LKIKGIWKNCIYYLSIMPAYENEAAPISHTKH
jgi:hypothetical protein